MSKGVDFIRYFYTNLEGRISQVSVRSDLNYIDENLNSTEKSKKNYHIYPLSLRLIPDFNTTFLDPFTHISVQNVICDLAESNCPRKRLKEFLALYHTRIWGDIHNDLITKTSDTEEIFFIFRWVIIEPSEDRTTNKYIAVNDFSYNIRSELVHELSKIGVNCLEHYNEETHSELYHNKAMIPGKEEEIKLTLPFKEVNNILITTHGLLQLADTIQIIRYFALSIAGSYGVDIILQSPKLNYNIEIRNKYSSFTTAINSEINPYTALAHIISDELKK